jgi:hypothetical protein
MLYEQNFNNEISPDCNYITELICKIDKIQRNILRLGDNVCEGCEFALLASTNNTIPISIYTDCCEAFTALIDTAGTTTNIFRIENIRCNRFVTLRLLETTTDVPPVIVGTNRTIVVDISKITALQCYEPITVEPCTATT